MTFGDLVGLKLPDIVLQVKKNSKKTSLKEIVPNEEWTRARCVTRAHATACYTAVVNIFDWKLYK